MPRDLAAGAPELDADRRRWLLDLEPDQRREALARLSHKQKQRMRHHWRIWARPEQLPPNGDWRTWVICAGRGFGKTRAGAE